MTDENADRFAPLPPATDLMDMPSADRVRSLEQESLRLAQLSAAIAARADYNAYFRALQTASGSNARDKAFACMQPETVAMIDALAVARENFTETLAVVYLNATDTQSLRMTALFMDALINRTLAPALDHRKLQYALGLAGFGGTVTDRFQTVMGLCVAFNTTTQAGNPAILPLATYTALEKAGLVVGMDKTADTPKSLLTQRGRAVLKRLDQTQGRGRNARPIKAP